jgi:serine/threonine protein kinase
VSSDITAVNPVYDGLSTALGDRYRVERELGTGGMATVYLAHDLKHDRDVAVKALHPDLAPSLGRERFLREIQLAARLALPAGHVRARTRSTCSLSTSIRRTSSCAMNRAFKRCCDSSSFRNRMSDLRVPSRSRPH